MSLGGLLVFFIPFFVREIATNPLSYIVRSPGRDLAPVSVFFSFSWLLHLGPYLEETPCLFTVRTCGSQEKGDVFYKSKNPLQLRDSDS